LGLIKEDWRLVVHDELQYCVECVVMDGCYCVKGSVNKSWIIKICKKTTLTFKKLKYNTFVSR
jgi:hypothetical protein